MDQERLTEANINKVKEFEKFVVSGFNYKGALDIYEGHVPACYKALELFFGRDFFRVEFDRSTKFSRSDTPRSVAVVSTGMTGKSYVVPSIPSTHMHWKGITTQFYDMIFRGMPYQVRLSIKSRMLRKSIMHGFPNMFGKDWAEFETNIKMFCYNTIKELKN